MRRDLVISYREGEMIMSFKEMLETNPILLTQIIGSIVALCGALGVKELLKMFYERWCKKADEEDTDHKLLMEMKEALDKIQEQLGKMQEADDEGMNNDILILEHNILFLQRKAITYGKVSKGCMPRYRMLFKRYKTLIEKSNLDLNEEVETNNEIVEKMFHDGSVVDSFWEMYK